MQEDIDAQMQADMDAQMQEDIDAQMQAEIEADMDLGGDYSENSVFNCHFEGGYNDM
jgi:hypothetical protein